MAILVLILDICNGILKTAGTQTSVLEYFLTVEKRSGVELKSSSVLTPHVVTAVEYLHVFLYTLSNLVSWPLYIAKAFQWTRNTRRIT